MFEDFIPETQVPKNVQKFQGHKKEKFVFLQKKFEYDFDDRWRKTSSFVFFFSWKFFFRETVLLFSNELNPNFWNILF